MRKSFIIVSVILLLASISWAENNRCYFKNFEERSGNKVSVEIYIANHDTLGGFQIPFSYSNQKADLVYDSVSFIDSRCIHFDMLDAQIDTAEKTILIMGVYQINPAVDQEPLYPGKGLVATAYFTANNLDDVRRSKDKSKKQVRFLRKEYKLDTNELDFSFWTPTGTVIESTYKNEVFSIEDEE